MRTTSLALAFALILLLGQAHGSSTLNSSSLTAGVNVECPFALTLGVHSVYTATQNQSANFSVYSKYNCSITSISGNFSFLEPNGTAVYTLPIKNISITQEPTLYNITFNASSVPAGTYTAHIGLSFDNSTNSASNTVLVNKPANVSIAGFSTSSSLLLHGIQSFNVLLNNTGSFALANSIKVGITISGPAHTNIIEPSNYSLSPSQTLNLTITTSNSTSAPGQYSATLNVTYTANKTIKSNYKTIQYTVIAPSTSAPVPKPSILVPQFSLLSFPYIVSIITGESQTGIINIKNNANVTEYISIDVPASYSDMLNLSATNLFIQPHQTVGLTALLRAPGGKPPGQYIIPLNITAKIGQTTASETQYITLEASPHNTSMLQSIILLNNTNAATSTIRISNPTDSNLTNIVVKTLLPAIIVKNVSDINVYGLPYSISRINGSYVIGMQLSRLPGNSSTYAYFSLANITAPSLLSHISETMAVTSPALVSSLIKVVDINVPTFYAGVGNYISVTYMYTGTSPQQVSGELTGPADVVIRNSSQLNNATPNGVYTDNFEIIQGSTGTTMLNLYIATRGANLSYSIPILVLAKPVTTTSTTTVPQEEFEITTKSAAEYSSLIITLLIITIVIIAVAKRSNKPKYDPERAEKLRRLRETIKRGG